MKNFPYIHINGTIKSNNPMIGTLTLDLAVGIDPDQLAVLCTELYPAIIDSASPIVTGVLDAVERNMEALYELAITAKPQIDRIKAKSAVCQARFVEAMEADAASKDEPVLTPEAEMACDPTV